jgi:hypothetical protein
MVRTTTEADDESNTTESYDAPEDVTVGDVIDVSGPSFLPKSNLEVVDADPEWATDYDGRVFEARVPNRKNARNYSFKITEYGTVSTTDSGGRFGVHVHVDVVEAAGNDDPAEGDYVVIRTDDGVITATVDNTTIDGGVEGTFEDGARLGGTLDADDPSVHYVDYYYGDDE